MSPTSPLEPTAPGFQGLVGQELGGFKLTAMLGYGGMAAVFRGENLLDSSIVRAIKVVHPWLAEDPVFARRFAEEARVLERLQHPNIVRFFGVRREGVHLLMELELLKGQPLSSIIRQAGRDGVPSESAVNMLIQASRGLAAAHQQGVVHRDIKPDNLFLTQAGEVKILDFGLARALDEAERAGSLTRTGAIPCTPGYLAPEVCQQGKPSRTSDVYALGMTLYEMLLGRHPFVPPGARLSPMELMFAQVQKELPRLSETRSDVPAALLEVALRATAKAPEARYADGMELLRALETSGLPGAGVGPHAVAGDSGVATLVGTTSLTQGELGEQNPADQPASTQKPSRLPRIVLAMGVLATLVGVGVWTMGRLDDADGEEAAPAIAPSAAMQLNVHDLSTPPDLGPGVPDVARADLPSVKGRTKNKESNKRRVKRAKRKRRVSCGSMVLNNVFKDVFGIRKIVEAGIGPIKDCFLRITAPSPRREVYGNEFLFAIKGRIRTMDPMGDRPPIPALQACLLKSFRRLPWPKPNQPGAIRILCTVD